MKSKLLGLGLGLTLSALGVAAVPAAAAFAATAPTTCYTGCTTAITSPPVNPVVTQATPVVEPAPIAKVAGGGSLPFTGADIEEMAAVGAGALLVGGLMVRRSRRVRQVAA